MAELFKLSARATNANGIPLSGAKAYFYATGTLTPATIYSNSTLTTPRANPVVADSGGAFPAVYLDPEMVYRTIITSSDGATTLYDLDPYNSEESLTSSGGSASIGFIQSGAGAAPRDQQAKDRDFVSPEDFTGANDSAKLTAALTARRNVILAAGASYSLKDVSLSNSGSVDGNGAVVSAATGAAHIFNLNDVNSRLSNIYISSSVNASGAAIKLNELRYAQLENITAVNCKNGFLDFGPAVPASEVCIGAMFTNLSAEGLTGNAIGVYVGSSVAEIQGTNLHIAGDLAAGPGGLKPILTTVGWRQQGAAIPGQPANAGHMIQNANMLGLGVGWWLSSVTTSMYQTLFASDCANYGFIADGACDHLDIERMTVTTTRGVIVTDSSRVYIGSLRTILNGTIPAWGSTDYYNGVTTFYDVEVRGTAQLVIGDWTGNHRAAVDSTAKLIVLGAPKYEGRSRTTVATNTTAYLAEQGQESSESAARWRAPYDCRVIMMAGYAGAAPGSGQSFSYNTRVNGVNKLTGTIVGASASNTGDVWAGTHIDVDRGQVLSIQVVTSNGAAVTDHDVFFQIVPRQS